MTHPSVIFLLVTHMLAVLLALEEAPLSFAILAYGSVLLSYCSRLSKPKMRGCVKRNFPPSKSMPNFAIFRDDTHAFRNIFARIMLSVERPCGLVRERANAAAETRKGEKVARATRKRHHPPPLRIIKPLPNPRFVTKVTLTPPR